MKTTFLFALGLAVLIACSSSSKQTVSIGAPAPVISQLSIASPITPGKAAGGQLQISDSAGLGDLSMTFTVTSPSGLMTMFSSPVTLEGSTTTETESPLMFSFELEGTLAAGTYKVSVTVSEDGAMSNALETSVVVQ
jgi:hypothetical protein